MDSNCYKKYEPIDGKWYINKELGRGAFGTVFEIERRDFSKVKSALKIITVPANPGEVEAFRSENYEMDDNSTAAYFYGFVEEFTKEIEMMYRLRGCPNIVSYEDHDVIPHQTGIGWDVLIRMELLTTMNAYFAANPPGAEGVVRMGADICRALIACRRFNIIHRDIKPANIFVTDTGVFKLGDFGVARTLEKTSAGLSKKGTYTYMAPEVYKGENYNATVDIYSLGIVMYKLLNGNMDPFRTEVTYASGEEALMHRMSGEALPTPKNASGKLAEIILKACAYKASDRYANAEEMLFDLESLTEADLAVKEEDKFEAAVDKKTFGFFSEKDETVGMFDTLDSFNENDETVGIFGKKDEVKKEEVPEPTPVPVKFCIWCGKKLEEGKPCTCSDAVNGKKAIYGTPEPKRPVSKAFCIYCGRVLINGEKCICPKGAAAPDNFCSHCGRKISIGAKCDCMASKTSAGVIKTTMRTENKPEHLEGVGGAYWTRPGDLD